MEENEQYFNFIYDDEVTLGSGRLPFWEWVKKENQRIEHGSRIVLTGNYRSYGSREDCKDRLFRYVNYAPPLPNEGVYEVTSDYEEVTEDLPHYYIDELESKGLLVKKGTERVERFCSGYENHEYHYQPLNKSIKINLFVSHNTNYIEAYRCTFKKEVFSILHNPKDTVHGSWGSYESGERKNRIRWKIYKTDRFVLNYDQISMEDIEFYLYNRTDRPNYLDMMPMLRTLKQWRLVEIENEKHFVKMVVGQLISEHKNKTEIEIQEQVWQLVEWWKFKNQIKRPVDRDDAKALRMIIKKFNKGIEIK